MHLIAIGVKKLILILNHKNQSDFERSIPKYLFREKGLLISIFNKYNDSKKKTLLNLLFNMEKQIRKNGELSIALGLRFLLSFKKITIA